jgi:hypothetical protein
MANLKIYIDDADYAKIKEKANGLGLSISNYICMALKETLPQTNDDKAEEILRSIRALIPTLVELDGRQRKNVTQAQIDEMTQTLLAHHATACKKGL